MKKFGESAIHDDGFQFYLTLNISTYINKLISDIKTLKNCIATHERWKNQESWYTSKTKASIQDSIIGYSSFTEFTLSECKRILAERVKLHKILIGIAEESLEDAVKRTKEKDDGYQAPFYKDKERLNVIVEEVPDI